MHCCCSSLLDQQRLTPSVLLQSIMSEIRSKLDATRSSAASMTSASTTFAPIARPQHGPFARLPASDEADSVSRAGIASRRCAPAAAACALRFVPQRLSQAADSEGHSRGSMTLKWLFVCLPICSKAAEPPSTRQTCTTQHRARTCELVAGALRDRKLRHLQRWRREFCPGIIRGVDHQGSRTLQLLPEARRNCDQLQHWEHWQQQMCRKMVELCQHAGVGAPLLVASAPTACIHKLLTAILGRVAPSLNSCYGCSGAVVASNCAECLVGPVCQSVLHIFCCTGYT
jgi:hypothetical protein